MYDSFYVDLLSNASVEGNTVANFQNKIQLMKPLEGNWEVALVEIAYTKSWKNLRNSFYLSLDRVDHPPDLSMMPVGHVDYFPHSPETRLGLVRAGYYETPAELCKEIKKEFDGLSKKRGHPPSKPDTVAVENNDSVIPKDVVRRRRSVPSLNLFNIDGIVKLTGKLIKDNEDPVNQDLNNSGVAENSEWEVAKFPELRFDEITKLIYIIPGRTTKKELILPALSEEASSLLGFDNYNTQNPKFNYKKYVCAERCADLDTCLKTLFVYTDIVEPQNVGDYKVRLLRTVEVPSAVAYGQPIVVTYDTPHYVPLLIKDFEHIIINIRDDIGETIPFMSGRTRVKLHFRKCQPNY